MSKELRIITDDLLNRHFVGFDRLFDQFAGTQLNSYPPHNVVQTGDSTRDIEFALAGFRQEDITVEIEDGVLTVTGASFGADDKEYLWQGIATRAFTKRFSLAEYWEVTNAGFKDGILTISTRQEIPEAKKPKTIKIEYKS